MTQPPRDENGVLPHDHPGIIDDDLVIRRINKEWVIDDPKVPGGKRVTSVALEPSSGQNGGLSVDLKRLIEEAGHDAKQWVSTPKFTGSIILRAGDLRAENFKVGYDPIDENPHHGEVWGHFSKGRKRKVISMSRWFVPIDGVALVL
jgi:hypothetical protein